MDQTVKRIVDCLFQDVTDNEEARLLHDEVMNNCQERYNDMVQNGYSQEEALSSVIESLRGMEEIVAQYRRNSGTPNQEPMQSQCQEDEEENTRLCFHPLEQGIQRIEAKLHETTLKILQGTSDMLEAELPVEGNLICTQEGSTLQISVSKSPREAPRVEPVRARNMGSFFSALFNNIGHMAESVLENVFVSSDMQVTLYLPSGYSPSCSFHTLSGDVYWKGPAAEELEIKTSSGDIWVNIPGQSVAKRVNLNSASGDITVGAAASEMNLKTMSGDVELNDVSADSLTASCVSGDIDGSASSAHCQLSSTSGDIQVHLLQRGAKQVTVRSTSGDVTVRLPDEEHEADISTHSVSGDVHTGSIAHNPMSQVKLQLNTVSGDIRVG